MARSNISIQQDGGVTQSRSLQYPHVHFLFILYKVRVAALVPPPSTIWPWSDVPVQERIKVTDNKA